MVSVLDVRKANDVESIGEEWSQLHSVPWLGCVIEVAVTRIDAVVAVVIEDHDVSR